MSKLLICGKTIFRKCEFNIQINKNLCTKRTCQHSPDFQKPSYTVFYRTNRDYIFQYYKYIKNGVFIILFNRCHLFRISHF